MTRAGQVLNQRNLIFLGEGASGSKDEVGFCGWFVACVVFGFGLVWGLECIFDVCLCDGSAFDCGVTTLVSTPRLLLITGDLTECGVPNGRPNAP